MVATYLSISLLFCPFRADLTPSFHLSCFFENLIKILNIKEKTGQILLVFSLLITAPVKYEVGGSRSFFSFHVPDYDESRSSFAGRPNKDISDDQSPTADWYWNSIQSLCVYFPVLPSLLYFLLSFLTYFFSICAVPILSCRHQTCSYKISQ